MSAAVAIHTFPVREGLTPEQCWVLIESDVFSSAEPDQILGRVEIERPCGWANALVVEGDFKGILPLDQADAEAMVAEFTT